MTSERERMLEGKLERLEERMEFAEEFIERFCGTFQDFGARYISRNRKRRNIDGNGTDFRTNKSPTTEENHSRDKSPPTTRRSSRQRSQNASAAEVEGQMKKCAVVLTRCSKRAKAQEEKRGQESSASGLRPGSSVCSSGLDDDGSGNDADIGMVKREVPPSANYGSDSEEDTYFTYPDSSVATNQRLPKPRNDKGVSDADCGGDMEVDRDDDHGGADDDYLSPDSNGGADPDPSDSESASKKSSTSLNSSKGSSKSRQSRLHLIPKPKKKKYPVMRLDMTTFKSMSNVSLVSKDPSIEECTLCHKFFKKELLASHMGTHAKERHLKCRFCDKSYFSLNTRATHEKTHNLEKYGKKCRICDKLFMRSENILPHERNCVRRTLEQNGTVDIAVLEDIKRRSVGIDLKLPDKVGGSTKGDDSDDDSTSTPKKKCPRCFRYFKLDDYPEHFRSHVVVRNWKCELCPKEYARKQKLMHHIVKAHGPEANKCSMCGDMFEDGEALRLHRFQCYKRDKKKSAEGESTSKAKGGSDDEEEEKKSKSNDENDDSGSCQ